ncbi:FecR family protein [Spirosoma panaciterrae]|uniref:FecR family protein n=1 Tax=Spirosoma panaciterrae TaxID=496058 RepID=UPI0003815605|nr:FecR family protein [Spirosoma panaciterrae]
MKNYQDYQIEDLLLNESFNRWASNQSSPDEQLFWQQWLDLYPEKREIAEQAKAIIGGLEVKPYRDISDSDVQQQLQQIQSRTHKQPVVWSFTNHTFGWWARAAAVLFLVLGIGWTIWSVRQSAHQSPYTELVNASSTKLIEKVNTTNAPLRVGLPDGSQVTLQPDSRISFSRQFQGTKREVYLTGEALFQVQKNPAKPFYVYANEVVTKVLGTSFVVKSFENQANVQVVVRTGRVSVFARKDWQRAEKEANSDIPGVVLTPNQQVVFNRQESHFRRTIIPNPVIIDSRFSRNVFVYDDTPVAQAFAQLEEAYGVDIVFDEQLLKQCTLTAKFQDEPLLEKLNLICQTIKASYQIVDAQIVISAQGCY